MAKKNMVNWESYEYIGRKRTVGWYVAFAVVVIAAVTAAIFLKEWLFLALIVVGAVALLFYVLRPPRMLHYSLNHKGLSEGNSLYAFSDFKSFGVLQEEDHYAIVLTPSKRFAPSVVVYFPETAGEEIVDIFGAHLPMRPAKLDWMDKLVRLLRI